MYSVYFFIDYNTHGVYCVYMISKDIIKKLELAGFEKVKRGQSAGSHQKMRHPDGRTTTIPDKKGKDVRLGTLKDIERQTEVKLR